MLHDLMAVIREFLSVFAVREAAELERGCVKTLEPAYVVALTVKPDTAPVRVRTLGPAVTRRLAPPVR